MRIIAALTLSTLLFLPQIVSADHGLPTATSVGELVEQFQANLTALADEYFLEPGEQPNFDEPRFNRLVGHARRDLEQARERLDAGHVCRAMRSLTRSVSRLDQATRFAQAAGMSGSGFSDDLASLTAARAQFFLEDLIVLAAQDPAVPPSVIDAAIMLEDEGDDYGGPDSGDWTPALENYTAGVCLIFRYL